jgi:hypothetical protein
MHNITVRRILKEHFLRILTLIFGMTILLLSGSQTHAQSELAAVLEVLAEGVEVKRVNTADWLPVRVEAIVGVGDSIRTDSTGRVRITYFADGTDTELLPNTEYVIDRFEGDTTSFDLSVTIRKGQTTQRLSRLLDAASSYSIQTPAMELTARGTSFAIRVESAGRSAMLVSEGLVAAAASDANAEVAPGFGVRADDTLSDVVLASTFEQLDAALDGCAAAIQTVDDVSINVRLGASLDYPRVGTLAATEITTLYGVTESGNWYRILFRSGYGWILSSSAQVDTACAGLRVFPESFGPEDPTLYTSLGDEVTLESLLPEATPDAGS